MTAPGPGKDRYRWIAKGYDAVVDPFNRSLWRIVTKLSPPQPGDAVLDVGCGTGTALASYQRAGYQASGIDLSEAMLARARRRLGNAVDLRLGDATSLPYDDASFDLVTAAFLIHEVAPATRGDILAEMQRVTRHGGRTLIIDHGTGPFVGAKGRIGGVLIGFLEFVAGREHFRNFRHYAQAGGVPGLADQTGVSITSEKVLGGGTVGVYVVAAGGSAEGS